MTPSSRALAQRVREARLGLELTQQELASMCGVSIWTISNIERGLTRDVSERVLGALATNLGVTIDDLVFGKLVVPTQTSSYDQSLSRHVHRAPAAPTDPQRRGRTSSRGGRGR